MGEDGLKMDGKYLEQVAQTCKFSSYNFNGKKLRFASAKKYLVVGAYYLSTPVYSGMCFIAFHGPTNKDYMLLRCPIRLKPISTLMSCIDGKHCQEKEIVRLEP